MIRHLVMYLLACSLPSVAASGSLTIGPAGIYADNGAEEGCMDPTGFCLVRKAGADLGGSSVNTSQEFDYVALVFEDERTDRFVFPLLPDGALVFDMNDYYVDNVLIHFLRESANVRAPAPLDDFGTYVDEDAIGLTFLGPPPKEPGAPFRRLDMHVNWSDEFNAEQIGPFPRLITAETDANIHGMLTFTCHFDTSSTCPILTSAADQIASATPNVIVGLDFYEAGIVPNSSWISNDSEIGTRAVLGLNGPREAPYSPQASHRREPAATFEPDNWIKPEADPHTPPHDRRPESTFPQPIRALAGGILDPPRIAAALAAASASALLLVAALLYARIRRKEEALRHEARQRLLEFLGAQGPQTVAVLARELSVDRTTVDHHVDVLVRTGQSRRIKQGRSVFVALPGQNVEPMDTPARPTQEQIITALEDAGGVVERAQLSELTAALPRRTRNHALNTLVKRGAIHCEWNGYHETLRLVKRERSKSPDAASAG